MPMSNRRTNTVVGQMNQVFQPSTTGVERITHAYPASLGSPLDPMSLLSLSNRFRKSAKQGFGLSQNRHPIQRCRYTFLLALKN